MVMDATIKDNEAIKDYGSIVLTLFLIVFTHWQ